MSWSKEIPKKEGWYFWRRSKNIKDSWKWSAIFIMNEYREESELDVSFWEGGTEIEAPRGGWWSLIRLGE